MECFCTGFTLIPFVSASNVLPAIHAITCRCTIVARGFQRCRCCVRCLRARNPNTSILSNANHNKDTAGSAYLPTRISGSSQIPARILVSNSVRRASLKLRERLGYNAQGAQCLTMGVPYIQPDGLHYAMDGDET